MSYAVKEIFLTLQGEGMQSGRRAVFLRFSGCNLWSGREQDRAAAQCRFCDTDFVGTDGENGGRYERDALVRQVRTLWGEGEAALVVVTGGEPMLQLDAGLIEALRSAGFDFYDWGVGEIRLVTSWDQQGEAVDRLAAAIAEL